MIISCCLLWITPPLFPPSAPRNCRNWRGAFCCACVCVAVSVRVCVCVCVCLSVCLSVCLYVMCVSERGFRWTLPQSHTHSLQLTHAHARIPTYKARCCSFAHSSAIRHITGLAKYMQARGLALVMWERNIKQQHLQLQALGIPPGRVEAVKTTLKHMAAVHGYHLEALSDWRQITRARPAPEPYFLIAFEDSTAFVMDRVSSDFNLQFGRCANVRSCRCAPRFAQCAFLCSGNSWPQTLCLPCLIVGTGGDACHQPMRRRP
jgi:hypothetical protein